MKTTFGKLALVAALASSSLAAPFDGPEKRDVTTVTTTWGGQPTTLTITFDPPGAFPTARAVEARDVTTVTTVWGGQPTTLTITFDPPGSFPTARAAPRK